MVDLAANQRDYLNTYYQENKSEHYYEACCYYRNWTRVLSW